MEVRGFDKQKPSSRDAIAGLAEGGSNLAGYGAVTHRSERRK